jgi:AraC-like DNA-binding protein
MAFVNGILSAARDHGVPIEALLHEMGIEATLLREPDARVSADQYIDLFRLVRDRLNDEGLGFFSRAMRPGSYAMVMRSLMSAPTLGRAMHRLAQGYGLLLDDARFDCVRDGELVALRMDLPPQPTAERDYVHEFMLRVFLHSLGWLDGGGLRAARIDFACGRPSHVGEYSTVFPGEVRFGQDASALWFDAVRLARPVRRDANALRDYLAQAPGHVVLPRRTDRPLVSRVRDHLQRERPNWPDLPSVANALHMSVSSLQRHLADERVSFQQVRNELRRDLAIVRLNTSAVPLAELAAELGFADNATFQRAFKAWTGSAPGAYRSRTGSS